MFRFGMSQIKSPPSILGHSQCAISHGNKQALFLSIDYIESSACLDACES